MNDPVQELAQTLLHLTRTDVLVWEYDKGGFYIASYRNRTFRLNCCTTDSLLMVDGEIYPIGSLAIKTLCNEIAAQSVRRRSELEKIQQLNDWLKEIA
jgi:hypothetical protein